MVKVRGFSEREAVVVGLAIFDCSIAPAGGPPCASKLLINKSRIVLLSRPGWAENLLNSTSLIT
jgi:hypothetical protein